MSKKKNNTKSSNMSRYLTIALLVLAGVLLQYFLNQKEPATANTLPENTTEKLPETVNVSSEYASLEMPAPLPERNEQIIRHTNYTVSYNQDWNEPNYVAWEVNSKELNKNVNRDDNFLADPTLDFKSAVISRDYSGSGYDRGHMCPAADNLYSRQTMEECFYMTNMCPQNHMLNQGRWNDLEIKCREWTKKYGQLYITCGPIFDETKKARYIGREHKVRVPDSFFKVILLNNGSKPRAVGFLFDNDDSDHPESYHSIDEIERLTGINFFFNLDDDIEDRIEAECDEQFWDF